MRNILLFFISSYKPTIQNGCYSRAQTNEAVLRKLQGNKDTRPDMILALCSESVRNNADVNDLHGGANLTTQEYFTQIVLQNANFPLQNFVSIPVPDTMNESAQAAAIHDIVQNVQPGDTLYIDLSGGMRDTAMLFVAVARYLRDIRDVTAHVLYTELVEGKPLLVRDSDKLYDLFDLISATDEFFATGRTASNADDTTFFRIATDDELNRYLDRSVQEGLLLLDESQRGRLIETLLGYQKVQQYRNQINHASDTVGLLPLTVRDVRATLEEICTALDTITDLNPNSNGVHRLSLTERLSYVPAQ